MAFKFNGDEILPCEGLVKFNGVNCREVLFNGTLVHNGIWPPGEATSFLASDSECEKIVFTWTDPVDPGSGTYVYDLYENGIVIASNVTSPHEIFVRYSTPRVYEIAAVGDDCTDPVKSIPNNGASEWLSDAVTNFNATQIECEQISFNWTNAVEDGFPDATYGIYQGGTLIQDGVTSPYTHNTTDEVPRPYHVKSKNNCAWVDSNTDTGQAATDPVAITNFAASDGQCEQITMTWSHEIMTASYNVYQGTNLIATNVSSGYVLNGIKQEAGIPYHVEQIGHCGVNTVSNTNNGSSDWKPEAAPTSFAASDNDQSILGQVRCTWTNVAAANNGSPNCTYNVYRNGTLVGSNVTSPWLHSTSSNSAANYYVRAVNACGYTQSNTNSGDAYQVAPPATTTFYSTGTCVPGVGHTLADVCIVGGGGGGGYRPSDNEHRGGGHKAGAVSQANISQSANFAVNIGGGGPGYFSSTLTGSYNGYSSTCLGLTAAGGGRGLENALIYYGQGAGSGSVCGFGAARDGYASTLSGDRSGGGQGSAGNGGSGEGVGGNSINGGTGAGGGASVGSAGGSGAGGGGVAIITTH